MKFEFFLNFISFGLDNQFPILLIYAIVSPYGEIRVFKSTRFTQVELVDNPIYLTLK